MEAVSDALTAVRNAQSMADNGGALSSEAMRAKTDADAAQTALNEAIADFNAAVADQDINTQDGAAAIKAAAEDLETAVDMAKDDAMAAETAAERASYTHALRLFQAANGAHVMDVEATPANERAAHVANVGMAMAAIAEVEDGNQASGTTVIITHPGDTVDNPATRDNPQTTDVVENNEFMKGALGIMVNVAGATGVGGNAFELRESRAAMDLNGDGDMTDDGEDRIIQTARKIEDLGDFQGYELWEDDGSANTGDFEDRARAIIFTNKRKGKDSVLAVPAATARSVTNEPVETPSELGNVRSTANTITGVTWTPSGETALTGTLTCSENCSITLGSNGAVTAIEGYTFTGSRAAVEAVVAAGAMENNDYLAFGLWLEESDNGGTDTFGAFATGGADYAVNVQNIVTGTATYRGKAAGAHHKTGEGVNWFNGDARLTANFGADDAAGTISGAISNIRVNGGSAMADSIYLGQASLTDAEATFNGAAHKGAETAPGSDRHEFNGTWSGSFFGATENDTATTLVNESETAPNAVAGTFGVTKETGTGDDLVRESFVGAFGATKQ